METCSNICKSERRRLKSTCIHMGFDTFGCFRGWCKRNATCLEYVANGVPADAADIAALRCSHCRCLPQEHVPAIEEGYDPNSPEHLAARRQYDVRLLPPEERAAVYKGRADAAYKNRNYRTAYIEYTHAIEATPNSHVLVGNRCQTYIKLGKNEDALRDAERAVKLAPEWSKGRYRLGMSVQLNQRHDEAVAAFVRACELEPENADAQKALAVARTKRDEWYAQQEKLAKARKRTTIRQASDAYEEAKYQAKQAAKRAGKIKDISQWGGELAEAFEREYRDHLRPPAGVEFALTYMPGVEPPDESGGVAGSTPGQVAGGSEGGGASGLVLEENAERESGLVLEENAEEKERGRSLVLEDNVEEVAPKGSDEDSDGGDSSVTEFSDSGDEDEEAKRDAALLDDSRWVPETSDGETRLTLPPRNYTLVHEDGRAHKADNFEPLSFGMQRVHNDDEPEPVWVQTPTARWMQTASEVSVIPYKVPTELCRGHEIKVSFARRLLHVQAVRSKEIFMAGELEEPINPNTSTWTTDGTCIMITCIKENLLLYNGARGKAADSHWGRLFKHDQYVERGMIAANYYDVPYEIKLRHKIAEAQRKEKEKLEKEANLCPLCDKDVRFFCECRAHDKDFERPLPQGWKHSEMGFEDNYDGYSLAEPSKLKPSPPPQPRPYQGRIAPKYGLDGKRLEDALPALHMLRETV